VQLPKEMFYISWAQETSFLCVSKKVPEDEKVHGQIKRKVFVAAGNLF
jgi:hypothetical protein